MNVIYARQSIDKKDSISIESQIDLCRKECNGEVVEYFDKGYSGKNTERPAFKQLMQAVEGGNVNKVVVYRLDRISRSITDFGRVWDILKQHNVEFVSVNEKFDTSSPVGRAMIYIIMVFAQLERETIVQRITDSYRYRSHQGTFMGGNKPFGYTSKKIILDGKNVSILEISNKQTVEDIFQWYLIGYNTHQIALKLNEMDVKTQTGTSWVSNKVIRILRNMTYAENTVEMYEYLLNKNYNVANTIDSFICGNGMCCLMKSKGKHEAINETQEQIICIGLHEPLVDAADWIRVQQKLDDKIAPKQAKRSQKSWLAGLIKCGECGYSFGLKCSTKNGKEYLYYHCRGREMRGNCSNSSYINSDELEYIVRLQLIARAKYKLKHFEVPKQADNSLKIELTKQIEAVQNQINNLIDNIGKGNATTDKLFTERITKLDEKISELKSKIIETIDYEPDEQSLNLICERIKFNFSMMPIDEKNKVAKLLIEKVMVDIEGNIKVFWRL